ncbi:MAG: hypothetical protein CVV45_16560 [Spirochaetae bacterium HGW-Spirochaetae-10]|nr:MAG: hypothetical protein CVV45_16560 [Spirochaetae bacterium HGW-Spirochaetae-10]
MKIERLKGESMTKKRLWLTVALSALIAPAVVHAQDAQPDYGIKFGGFVKFDAFNDSRRVVGARDDMFLLYPAARSQITSGPSTSATTSTVGGAGAAACDPQTVACPVTTTTTTTALLGTDAAYYVALDNRDLNNRGQTHFTAVQSRLIGRITAPDAFGAKVTGLLEGDFFGPSEATIYSFGLRHAWINLDWGTTSIRFGQDWHPLFLASGVFPGTIQFNPIAPIHPFARNPQIALTQKMGDLKLSLYALEQSGHADLDTTGTVTTRPLRNGKMPELAAQLVYAAGPITFGGTIDHKRLRPSDDTNPTLLAGQANTRVGNNDEEVKSTSWQVFGQFKANDLTVKLSTTIGENLYNALSLGGYAVKKDFIIDNLTTTNSGMTATEINTLKAFTKREYLPLKTQAYWAEIAYGKEVEFGIVGGRIINLGAADYINTSLMYARGGNIKEVITIAPRIKFTSGKTMIGLEYIYSEAAYMEDDKNYQSIINAVQVLNGVTNPSYTTLSLNGVSINNGAIRDDKGKIGETYTAINHRIQLSVQQNF